METKARREQLDDAETTIDLGEVFSALWSNFAAIILTAIIGALVAYLISATLITPEFSSTTKLYVMANEQQKTDNGVDTGTLQAGALLTKDYEQIIESREVTETVITNLKLKDKDGTAMTSDELIKKVAVEIPDETRVVNITVTDEDPYRACDIANAIRDVAEERIQSVMDMKTVKVVESANVPTKPDSPNKMKNAVIGGLIGLLLAAAIVVIRHISDNTIRTSEDVQNYLGVSVLAAIPLAEGEKKGKKQKSRAGSKKRQGARRE